MFPARHFVATLAATLVLAATTAQAAIYTVGSGGGCTHPNIQSAIASAELNPGADTIRITRTLAWTQQALSITTSQHLNVVGGFATCDQAATDNTYATVDGEGGALEPVFRINVGTGGIVKLRHLNIRGGDEDGSGFGGGIYFRGDGILELIETNVQNNVAGYGGGIYAEGTGSNAELVISNDVLIQSNTARYSGGGVYNDGVEMTMVAPDSWIAFNKATGVFNGTAWVGGYGGGIQIVGGSRDSYTYLGSPGIGGAGPVYWNEARLGGGISLISNPESAVLQLFSADPARQTSIRDNFASIAGGALYLRTEDRGGFVVGYPARAAIMNASLVDNGAPEGAAIFISRTPGLFPVGQSGMWIDDDGVDHPAAIPCPSGRSCNHIGGHISHDGQGGATNGSVIVVEDNGGLFMDRTELSGNAGGRVLRAVEEATVEAVNTLWTGNAVALNLIRTEDDVDLLVENSTVAGNALAGTHVISSNGQTRLQRSIFWQVGKTIVSHSGDPLFAQNIIANERMSLDGGNTPYVLEANPRFVDPANADFRLRAASPAVDFASTGGGADLVGVLRGFDLPFKLNRMGTADLGAYERPAVLPLIHNGDFDDTATGRLNLWLESTPGVSSWTADQNATGAAGSGSILVSQSNITSPRVTARVQCIHLPGPGRYLLNGWGRSGGQNPVRDSVLLNWELRYNGGENCTNGVPQASGDHFLSTSGSWVRPANPAVIDLPSTEATHNSSLLVRLVVIDNGITFPAAATGWFDGITLEVESGDLIFANGFESN